MYDSHRVVTEAVAVLREEDGLEVAFDVALLACKRAALDHVLCLVANQFRLLGLATTEIREPRLQQVDEDEPGSLAPRRVGLVESEQTVHPRARARGQLLDEHLGGALEQLYQFGSLPDAACRLATC